MNTKSIIVWVIIVIVVGVGAFFGGSAYGKSQVAATSSGFAGASARGTFAGRGFGGSTGSSAGTATSGTILSTSGTSITVQLKTGSTQIVFVSTSTPIMKTTSGSLSDLAPGDQVTVIGTSNSDGSLTANSIQLRAATTTAAAQ